MELSNGTGIVCTNILDPRVKNSVVHILAMSLVKLFTLSNSQLSPLF